MTDLPTTRTDEEGEDTMAKPVPRPHLFLVLEAHRPLAPSARYRLDVATEIRIGRGTARVAALEATGEGLLLTVRVPDPWMSAIHAHLHAEGGCWAIRDEHSKNRIRRNGATVRAAALADGDVLELGHTVFVYREGIPARAEEPYELDLAQTPPLDPALATVLPVLVETFRKVAAMAPSDVAVLIGGDTGTGKERVARAVHALSHRPGHFVAVNCGAIPDALVESELFGHRAGAFTGAVSHHHGLVRAADRGTLFLDEIGDLPLPAQAALLRVLQERSVTPVGGTKPVHVDFRLVSATNRSLEELVSRGAFRQDLYARLGGFAVHLPPLRERREDLGLLTAGILQRLSPERAPRLSFLPSAIHAMLRHPFRLNIRELENVLASALALNGGDTLTLEDLPSELRAERAERLPEPPPHDPLEIELRQLLAKYQGNLSAVARAMRKDRNQIRRWLRRFGLQAETFRP